MGSYLIQISYKYCTFLIALAIYHFLMKILSNGKYSCRIK